MIFAAGRAWRPGFDMTEYRRAKVGIPRTLFEALGTRRDLRVVFTSSMSTIDGSRTPLAFAEDTGREHVREGQLNPYDYSKIECEQIALEHAAGE